jgi:hypothetical protein
LKLLRHRAAQGELRQAIAWYERAQPGLGEEFADAVRAAFAAIEAAPERWPVWRSEARIRYFVLSRFPYTIRGGVTIVVAVAHNSRKPDYWAKRLRAMSKHRHR